MKIQNVRESLGQTIFLSSPVVCWCLASIYWLSSSLHILLAIPAGFVMGVVLWFLVGQLVNSGTSSLMELNVGATIGLVLALILVPVFAQAREKARATTCLQSVKAASVALVMYARDNDGYLPPGAVWETAVRPYVPAQLDEEGKKVELEIKCPLAPAGSGYALSQSLVGGTLEKVANLDTTPLLFDANVNSANAVATLQRLPRPGRHQGGNTVGYADGHAKWQKIEPLPPAPPAFYVQARSPQRVAQNR